MSQNLLKKIVRYRNILVALGNAGVTWIILIIAPLGLFAVIICTIAVFLSSLAIGFCGDWAMFSLLQEEEVSRLKNRRNRGDFSQDSSREINSKGDRDLPERENKGNLPDEDTNQK